MDKLPGRKGLLFLLQMRELRLRDVKSGSQSHTASTVHSGTGGRVLARDGGSALLSLALEAVRYLSTAWLLLMTDLKKSQEWAVAL